MAIQKISVHLLSSKNTAQSGTRKLLFFPAVVKMKKIDYQYA